MGLRERRSGLGIPDENERLAFAVALAKVTRGVVVTPTGAADD
jgi:hypothetical protein